MRLMPPLITVLTLTPHISPMCVAPNCTIIDEDYAIAVMHIHTRYTHKLYTHVIHTGWRTAEGFHKVFV